MSKIEIRGGRVVDPASRYDEVTNVYIEAQRVYAISKHLADFHADLTIDATGLVVCPGFIELSAHIQSAIQAGEGALAAELEAAVACGITTLAVPPSPQLVADSPAVVELVHRRADVHRLARVEILGALTAGLGGEALAEMYTLMEAGCPAVSNGLVPVPNTEMMRRALEYAATFGATVLLHCQDPWLTRGGRLVHGGENSFRLGLEAIPEAAETVAVARELLLVEHAGVRAHFCRLTTRRAVELVTEAKARGLAVTADVGAPYLFLTDEDIAGFDARCHVNPPLRTAADRDALRAGLASDALDCLVADHQPRGTDAKLNPFPDTAPGISGLDTLLPLALRWMEESEVPLATGLAALTSQPASVLRLERGKLAPGAVADICLFDPMQEVVVNAAMFLSRGHNSPFDGMRLRGGVKATFVDGRLVYRAADLPAAELSE